MRYAFLVDAWIRVRRIAHTAHHRGRQTARLRMLQGEAAGGAKAARPGPGARPPTERPGV